jgi:hypothetical protein
MGFIYSFLTVFLLSLNLASDIPYTELEQAFSNGNAQAISSMGKEKMLISILDKEGAYSQSQATQVLKDFFTKKPVSSFKFTFKGKETNDGSFAIGEYVSKQDNFRVTVQFKKLNQQFKIERLTIEAD